jgi:c-di-GMP-binding flagellar brake protein YcgR
MNGEMNHKEARKNKRFRTDGKVFAAFFGPSREFVKLGHIVDISEGGVGLLCLDGTEQTSEMSQLEIFASNEQTLVGRLPCKVVYDMELGRAPQGKVTLRRCGVQFDQLSGWQAAALRAFIESHKSGEA